MSTVFTVEAKIKGDASSLIAASKQGTGALDKLGQSAEQAGQRNSRFGEITHKAMSMAAMAIKVVGGVAVAAAGGGLALSVSFFKAAARAQELDVAMRAVGKSTGLGYTAISQAAQGIKAQGIEMGVAQQMAIQFAQAHLDLASAAKISRVAQDLAVVSGKNSTEETATLLDGIMTQNSMILRGAGIMKTAQDAYIAYANAHHTTQFQLSETQKKQALLNMIMSEGAKVAGTYEAAMTSPSKVLRSMPRLINDISISLGQPFLNAVGPAIVSFYHMVKAFDTATSAGGALEPMVTMISDKLTVFLKPLRDAVDLGVAWVKNLSATPSSIARVSGVLDKLNGGFVKAVASLSPLHIVFVAVKAILPKLAEPLSRVGNIVTNDLIPSISDLLGALVPILPVIGDLIVAFSRGLGAAIPMVTGLVENLLPPITSLVKTIADLPEPVLAAGVAFLAIKESGIGNIIYKIADGFLTLGTSAYGATGSIFAFSSKMATVASEATGMASKLAGAASFLTGPWGIAIGIGITALGLLALNGFAKTAKNVDELTASLDTNTGAMTTNTAAAVASELHKSGTFKTGAKYGLTQDVLTGAAMGDKADRQKIDDAYARAKKAIYNKKKTATGAIDPTAYTELNVDFGNMQRDLGSQSAGIAESKSAYADNAISTGQVAKRQEDLAAAIGDSTKALKANGIAYVDNKGNVDESSSAYMANKLALDKVGAAGMDVVDVLKNTNASQSMVDAGMRAGISSYIKTATAMGIPKAKAEELAAAIFKIPKKKVIQIEATVTNAQTKIDDLSKNLDKFKNQYSGITLKMYLDAITGTTSSVATPKNTKVKADGGIVYAANGMMRDSMIARGGANILWAEPETGWEAYISGKPSQAKRSADIWAQTGKKLGLMGGGDSGGISELGPQSLGLLRQIAEKNTVVSVGDQPIAQAAGRGSRQNARAGKG